MPTETEVRRLPLDTPEAAIYVSVKPNYLEKLRCNGSGPVFIKHNGLVRYDPDDLDAWLEAGKRKSTADVELWQWALVSGDQILVMRFGEKPDLSDARFHPAGYAPGDGDRWLPVVNVDSEPLDRKLHWRLDPLPLRIDGDRVVREYPVVLKSWEHM
jgi:hypothetical protein